MEKYYQSNLSDGAKLYYIKNTISKTTNVKIGFECGARVEPIPGLAHFCEHLFFCGTKNLTSEQVKQKYYKFIDVNAYTSESEIVFVGNVFTKEFTDYVKMVAEIITESTFTPNSIKKELPVIKQEIATAKDKYRRLANDVNMLNITQNNMYNEISVLGNSESVSTIKSKDIKEFVKKYFVKQNLEVYVTSPLPMRKIKNIIEKELVKKLESKPDFKKLPLLFRYVKQTEFYDLKHKDIGKSYYFLNFKSNHNMFDWEFKAKYSIMLAMINDFSDGLMKYLRNEKSLVYGANMNCYIANDKEYLTTINTECEKENLIEITKTIAEYIKNILKNGFTQELLDKAKRLYIFDQDAKEPCSYSRLAKLRDFKYYGKVYKDGVRKLAQKVKLEEVNQLFKEIFQNPMVSCTIYGDATKKDVIQSKEFYKLFK